MEQACVWPSNEDENITFLVYVIRFPTFARILVLTWLRSLYFSGHYQLDAESLFFAFLPTDLKQARTWPLNEDEIIILGLNRL